MDEPQVQKKMHFCSQKRQKGGWGICHLLTKREDWLAQEMRFLQERFNLKRDSFYFREMSRFYNGSLNDFVSFLDVGESWTEGKEKDKTLLFVWKSWQQGSKRDSNSFYLKTKNSLWDWRLIGETAWAYLWEWEWRENFAKILIFYYAHMFRVSIEMDINTLIS